MQNNVCLVRTRAGQSSADLETKPNSGAFEFGMTIRLEPKGADFGLTPTFQGRAVKEIHEVLSFELALGKPGRLALVDRKTGLAVLEGSTGASEVGDHVSELEEVVGQLVTIQQMTGQILNWSRELTEEDFQQALILHAAVTAGSYQSGPVSFTLQDPDPRMEGLIGKAANLKLVGSRCTILQVFDTTFDLGRAEMSAVDCTLSREKIDGDQHHFVLKPDPGEIAVSFPDWQQRMRPPC